MACEQASSVEANWNFTLARQFDVPELQRERVSKTICDIITPLVRHTSNLRHLRPFLSAALSFLGLMPKPHLSPALLNAFSAGVEINQQ
jgi:hypothetical protein